MAALVWNRTLDPQRSSLTWLAAPPRPASQNSVAAVSDDAEAIRTELHEESQQRAMSVTEKVAVAGLILSVVAIALQWRQMCLWRATLQARG